MELINKQRNIFGQMKMNMDYFNGFEKAKASGQKFLKHLQKLNTKLHGKHWLYTVLCCRFNATQRLQVGLVF